MPNHANSRSRLLVDGVSCVKTKHRAGRQIWFLTVYRYGVPRGVARYGHYGGLLGDCLGKGVCVLSL